MDGLDSFLSQPLYWAAQVVLDHIDIYDPEQVSEVHLNWVLENVYEFICCSFEEEGLDIPSKLEIVREALEWIGHWSHEN